MDRTRRSVVTALATGALAGCIGRETGSGNTDTTTTQSGSESGSTPTTGPDPAADVSLSDIAVQPGFVALNSPDSIDVYGSRNEQFVIATFEATSSPAPDVTAFSLEVGDASVDPDEDVGGMGGGLWDFGEPYAFEGEGWIAFVVSNPIDVERAVLTWPGGAAALSADAVAALARPPTTFEVREVTAPDSVGLDESAALTLSVENTGETDGTWMGALNRIGPSVAYIPEETFAVPIPAGETETWTYTNTPEDRFQRVSGTMRFDLRWRDGSLDRTVEVRTESTEPGGA